jgi:hypothetical protein
MKQSLDLSRFGPVKGQLILKGHQNVLSKLTDL